MHFKDLDRQVAKNLQMDKKEVRKILKETEVVMFNNILFGQEILIRNIGLFELRIAKSRDFYDVTRDEYRKTKTKYRLALKVSAKLTRLLAKKTVYES